MSEHKAIIVYGTTYCSDCYRSKKFLDRHQIPYHWINIENDLQGLETVRRINDGHCAVPTLIFPDGTTLTEPNEAELAARLGINL